jgi:hypothetical protein
MEKSMLTNTVSQILCWADLRGSAVAERHYYALFLVSFILLAITAWMKVTGEKTEVLGEKPVYHFTLYKFQTDFSGIEC